MLDKLKDILVDSRIVEKFKLRREDDNVGSDKQPLVAYRVSSNDYKIRSFEFVGTESDYVFRIYYNNQINEELKSKFDGLDEVIKTGKWITDYKCDDYLNLAKSINVILEDKSIQEVCRKSTTKAKTSVFEGLSLPDIDVVDAEVMGQTYTWKDIISIWENESEDNKLKKQLLKKGIYIQRDEMGKSRYIGSAYGDSGIIGRWMEHLKYNGNAKHLNLFVLENGYNNMLFSVIEFYDGDDIIKRESMWKKIIGTINHGPYNGYQLNNN